MSTICKNVIIEELDSQMHPERVEDVIFWALEYYANNKADCTWGKIIASTIVDNIKCQEDKIRRASN